MYEELKMKNQLGYDGLSNESLSAVVMGVSNVLIQHPRC